MAYYLGMEVKQMAEGVFISQQAYAKEVFKKFNIMNCTLVVMPLQCGVKLSKKDAS